MIQLKKLVEEAKVPEYKTEESAGMDLFAYVESGFTIIEPGERKLIRTGIAIQMDKGFYAEVCSRSGLAIKYGIFVLNAPGIIDTDYTGEIGVILMNSSKVPFKIDTGDRIAQLVIHKLIRDTFKEVIEFDRTTQRGEDGFGSTGMK